MINDQGRVEFMFAMATFIVRLLLNNAFDKIINSKKITDRTEEMKHPMTPVITAGPKSSFFKLVTKEKNNRMITKNTIELKKNFRRLRMVLLSLLHFGQCKIFIYNKVFRSYENCCINWLTQRSNVGVS